MHQLRPESPRANSKIATSLLVLVVMLVANSLRADTTEDFSALFSHSVPLKHTGAGSYSVAASVGGVEAEFLLDTGASMATVSATLFKQIRKQGKVAKIRSVGARLASGKVEVLDVYLVERFSLGNGCELGPAEVAVLKHGERNLLGMSVLQQTAPFAISLSPPALGLSRCGFANVDSATLGSIVNQP